MTLYLLLLGIVILICILLSRFLNKIPVPSLLFFIVLGMLFGENGIVGISFNNYIASEAICSACLIFIMFYGGFGTNLKSAKSVVVKSAVLSTLGVILTAFSIAAFGHYVLNISWGESFLIGSVISSTDAASVFNILRSQKLSLKYNTDSLLELESGSNDPISYMMTILAIALLSGSEISIPILFLKQLGIGIVFGLVIGKIAVYILNSSIFTGEHEKTVLVFAVAVIAYATATAVDGNGYLSVYLCGIYMGNAHLSQKRYLVHFFDVVTDVAQVMIFFLLGLLVTPKELPQVLVPAILFSLFLTLIARPFVIGILLACFRSKMPQIALVSWAGLRGVASIVFAIMAMIQNITLQYNLFNLVFCIVLLSLSIQATLLPWVSRKLKMIDENADVNKTFNDYQEESDVAFIKIHIGGEHPWKNRKLKDLQFLKDLLAVMIFREGQTLIPNGNTTVQEGDLIVLASRTFEERENLTLRELFIEKSHKWNGKSLGEIQLPKGGLIVLIQREGKTIIPRGNTRIKEDDVLVIAESN